MAHQCKALAVVCMDFRFHTAIREFLVSLDLKDQYDLVSLAGVMKGLVEKDPASSELILKQVEISRKLHGISEVIIIHHMDCGAYGGHQAFPGGLIEEKARQLNDLAAAESIIRSKFPDLAVRKVLARIEAGEAGNKIDFELAN